jgi:hypothetical protein
MTRFEEIQALVEKNKSKKISKEKISNSQADSLEVPGLTESSKGGNPHMEFATDEQDADLIDMLYTKPKYVPNRGESASYWDSDND